MGEAKRRREAGGESPSAPRLYHFTSENHVEGCRGAGIVHGKLSKSRLHVVGGYQWLTTNPDRAAQLWARQVTLPYDRTAFRLEVRIPAMQLHHLAPWLVVGDDLVGAERFAELNACGGAEDWWIFAGRISPHWIRRVVDMRDTTPVPPGRAAAMALAVAAASAVPLPAPDTDAPTCERCDTPMMRTAGDDDFYVCSNIVCHARDEDERLGQLDPAAAYLTERADLPEAPDVA